MNVTFGFSGAGYLIYTSFHNWEQSPISTTIETLPISQIKFPNVTVCPPRNSFLNLNYDFKQSETIKIDNNSRKKLFDFALDVIQDDFHKEVVTNLSKVEDPDRYYNWYHGYTLIAYPYHDTVYNQLFYHVTTSATSGNISTQYFGDKFEANKVDGNIYFKIYIIVPPSVGGDQNTTLMVDIKKKTMKEVSNNDKMTLNDWTDIDADLTNCSKNITAPSDKYSISLDRKVTADDIYNMDLDMMPGFTLTWNYDKHIEPKESFSSQTVTKQFAR